MEEETKAQDIKWLFQATFVNPGPLVSWFITHFSFQDARLLHGTQKPVPLESSSWLLNQTETKQNNH